MKLTYFQLEPHFNKTLGPIYIVSGDELLLKQDAINLIRKAAKKAGIEERLHITPEAGFDWEQLYTLLYSNSLLAEKRLLEIDFRDTTPNKAASKILEEYGNHPAKDNVLLIDIGKVDIKIAKSPWYKSLEKAGHLITIWPIPHEQLPGWIMQRIKRYKLTMQPEAAKLLADYVEGNLVAAAQTIEKIYLHRPEQTIDADFIHTILTDESRFTVFDLIENLVASNKARTLHILENLKEDGAEPVIILWGITRELRLLAELSQQIKQGQSFEMLFQKYRIFSRRQPAMRQFLNRVSAESCWHNLSRAAEIDNTIKGFAPGNSWDALELLCMGVMG